MREPLCQGRDCLVVGSAPGVDVRSEDRAKLLLAANGGAGVCFKATGRSADVLLTTAHLFRDGREPHEEQAVESMRGQHFRSVWVDIKNGLLSTVRNGLALRGASCSQIIAVGSSRPLLVASAVGEVEDEWVSTGVWAACLAYVSGAKSVEVTGVDPSAVGHAGLEGQPRRDHVKADSVVVEKLKKNGVVFR